METSEDKDTLLYEVSKSLYDICKRHFCSCPFGRSCYGVKKFGMSDDLTPPCEKCEIGEKREFAVAAMNATNRQMEILKGKAESENQNGK